MKLKMFKKIVSLASTFTIVATCLAGLNFSASAAAHGEYEVKSPATEITVQATVGASISIEPKKENGEIVGMTVGANDILFNDGVANPTVKLEEEKDENGKVIQKEGYPDVKWVIETAKPGSASSNAYFRNEKDTKKNDGYTVKSVTNTDYTKYGLSSPWNLTLGGFKANGQLNNIVDVRLVSKSYGIAAGSGEEKGKYFLKNDDQKEYLSFRVYINPKNVEGPVCTTTKATDTPNKGIKFDPTTKTLQIEEGKSFKLPFKASTGDAGLTWTSNAPELFTVVNGTVKAVRAGTGSVNIKSINNTSAVQTVTVTVTPVVSAIRTNVSTVDLITKLDDNGKDANGDIQYITVAPKTSTNAKIKYTLSLKNNTPGIEFVTNDAKLSKISAPKSTVEGGVLTFGIRTTGSFSKLNSGEKIVIKAEQVDANSLSGKKQIKDVNVTLKTTTYPDYVKNFKETVKADKVTGYREVNVQMGSTVALNLSVNPVTAINNFTWEELYGNSNGVTISDNGDVVKGNTCGTYYYQATSTEKDKDGNPVKSSIYKINVYKAASSFEFDDKISTAADEEGNAHKKMVVKGGYLMEASNAEKACDKTINAGEIYKFSQPSCGANNEPIVWTSNKPEAVVYVDENKAINLVVLRAGTATYTITGTSQYTKQKYSFKVIAAGNEEDSGIDSNSKFDDSSDMIKGETYQIIPKGVTGYTANSKDKVTFTSTAPKAVSVSATGLITAKNVTDEDVTVEMKIGDQTIAEITVNVNDSSEVKPVLTVSKSSINGKIDNNITLTVKNAPKGVAGKYTIKSGDDTIGAGDIAANGKATAKIGKFVSEPSEEPATQADEETADNSKKVYTITVTYGDGEDAIVSDPVELTAYNGFMTTKPSIIDPATEKTSGSWYDNATVAPKSGRNDAGNRFPMVDLKTMSKNKTYNKDGSVKVNAGVVAGETVRIPIGLVWSEGKGKDKVTYYNKHDVVMDDIEWTSSNNYIVKADSITEVKTDRILASGSSVGSIGVDQKGKTQGKYYQEYQFATNPNYTGKVVLTGIMKNSGQKVTLTLYVVKDH